ncbi:flagellar hook-associated protein FlgL [soil metagenome]
MRIATTGLYDRTTSQMTALSKQADTLSTQVSTGKKLATASEDPLAWSRLTTLRKSEVDAGAYSSNVTLAQTLVSQSDTALASVQSRLTRAQELAVQANTGVLSDANKDAIATELKGILSDLATLANSKDVRGQPLFGGASEVDPVSVASDGSVTITATGTPPSIPIGDGSTVQPTDSAAKVFGNVAGANGTTDMFSILSNLISAVENGGDVATASTDLTTAATQVTNARASVGARGSRLDLESESLKSAATDREILRSGLEDTDVATAITELQKTITILSATQASFTKLSSLSLFDYIN